MLTEQNKRRGAQGCSTDLKSKAANVTASLPEKRPCRWRPRGRPEGPEDATVTIVEFSDFQCPFCGKAEGTVDEVMKQYAGKVRLVFRHFPLSFHEHAPKAAEAAACAEDQGKFWEMHEKLFANQRRSRSRTSRARRRPRRSTRRSSTSAWTPAAWRPRSRSTRRPAPRSA